MFNVVCACVLIVLAGAGVVVGCYFGCFIDAVGAWWAVLLDLFLVV